MNESLIGILLAAGRGERFGANKLLHPLPDTRFPLAVQAASVLLQALPRSIAVVRPDDLELKTLLSATSIDLVDNEQADEGIGSSIRCGVNAAGQHCQGYIIALADMPFIPVAVFEQVADALRRGALICAPRYRGQRGHPVGFSSQLSGELQALQGDSGAKAVIENNRDQLQLIDVDSDVVIRDIDRQADIPG